MSADADSDTLHIAEIPYDSGALRCRYARYMSADKTKWVRHGLYQAFYPDGTMASEGTYEHGKEHGPWKDYHKNGRLAAEGSFEGGEEKGVWRYWDADGVEEESEDHGA